ncbi:DUF4131 domain-containing protein [Phycobium rhodophyticola]
MRALARMEMSLWAQQGHLFPWAPVCLAVGIGAYFGLSFEPELAVFPYLGGAIAVLGGVALLVRRSWTPLIWGVVLIGVGFGVAAFRAHTVERPVLGWRYYGPVEGRVIGIDRSGSGAVRLLLDEVVLARVEPRKRPERVRVSLHGAGGAVPEAGARVIVTAHLSPPGGPVEPGALIFNAIAGF